MSLYAKHQSYCVSQLIEKFKPNLGEPIGERWSEETKEAFKQHIAKGKHVAVSQFNFIAIAWVENDNHVIKHEEKDWKMNRGFRSVPRYELVKGYDALMILWWEIERLKATGDGNLAPKRRQIEETYLQTFAMERNNRSQRMSDEEFVAEALFLAQFM